jgi:hypothetical protein
VDVDLDGVVPDLPAYSRFNELLFEDATVSFADHVAMRGPSPSQKMHAGWQGFLRLCERADVVKMRSGVYEERILEREEWERAHEIDLQYS